MQVARQVLSANALIETTSDEKKGAIPPIFSLDISNEDSKYAGESLTTVNSVSSGSVVGKVKLSTAAFGSFFAEEPTTIPKVMVDSLPVSISVPKETRILEGAALIKDAFRVQPTKNTPAGTGSEMEIKPDVQDFSQQLSSPSPKTELVLKSSERPDAKGASSLSQLDPSRYPGTSVVIDTGTDEGTFNGPKSAQADAATSDFDRSSPKTAIIPEKIASIAPNLDTLVGYEKITFSSLDMQRKGKEIAKSVTEDPSERSNIISPSSDTKAKMQNAPAAVDATRGKAREEISFSLKSMVAGAEQATDFDPSIKSIPPAMPPTKPAFVEVLFQHTSENKPVVKQQQVKVGKSLDDAAQHRLQNTQLLKNANAVQAPLVENTGHTKTIPVHVNKPSSSDTKINSSAHILSTVQISHANPPLGVWPLPSMISVEKPNVGESALIRGLESHYFKETTDIQRLQVAPQKAEVITRPVVNQLTHKIKTLQEGSIEVRLAPEELGRVRLSLSPGEANITVHINAERPETAELIRRNIELFSQALKQEGFSSPSFSFDDSEKGESDKHKTVSEVEHATESQPSEIMPTLEAGVQIISHGQVDIRI